MAVTLAQDSVSTHPGAPHGRPVAPPQSAAPARLTGAQQPTTSAGSIKLEKFVIEGGAPLSGTITAAGNKNGALPILAACLLTEDEVILRNVPRISDVEAMVTLDRGALGPTTAPGRYAWFSRTVNHAVLTPPGVGEHTSEVLAEAGLSAAEIEGLIASGAVRQGAPIVYRSFLAYR